jgi:hypothetical protein
VVPPDLNDEAGWQQRYFDLEQDLDTGPRARPHREEPAGRPLGEVTDPFTLEVHRPVQPDAPQRALPALPAYVAREHDTELARVVAAAADGRSGIAVLVGGSSTGKTRACWEALRLLRERGRPWRLWHPIDPSRPEAALRDLGSIGPRTVVWLNEAQFYLGVSSGGLGERVAAGLRELLRDPARTPVLVLATLWPEYWDRLTARPPAGADPHAHARELMTGRDITVPAAFPDARLKLLAGASDPRLAQAAAAAEDGQVIQFLAGAPVLMARYRNAPPAAAALIRAAMDARRLGMGAALPLAFLQAATPGYLTDANWDGLGDDWLEQALAYTAAPCNGIRGPLTRIRPRTTGSAGPATGPAYRLADYLDQHGRRARRLHIPAADFWDLAARFADPRDLRALARSAEDRGLLRHAAFLRKHATSHGNAREAASLVRDCYHLRPGMADPNPAQWAAAHAALDNPADVAGLLAALREARAEEQTAALLARDPGAHASLDDPGAVTKLLAALREAGAKEQAVALATRAAAHTALDNLGAVAGLLTALREVGAEEQAVALATRAAAHVALDNPLDVAGLVAALREAGAKEQAVALATRAAAHTALDNLGAVAGLLTALREVGAEEQAVALAVRAAAHAALDDPTAVAELLIALREAGAEEQTAALAARAAAHAALDDPTAVTWLLAALRKAGAEEHTAAFLARDPSAHVTLDDPLGLALLLVALREAGAEAQTAALAARAAAHAALDDSAVGLLLTALWEARMEEQTATLAARATLDKLFVVEALLNALRKAGAEEQTAALAARAAAHAALDDPFDVAELLTAFRKAEAAEPTAALLVRDPAAHAALDNPGKVAHLLTALREVGAQEQTGVLAARAAAHAAIDNLYTVAQLLTALWEVGAQEQTAVLAARAAERVALDDPGAVTRLLTALREVGAQEQTAVLAARAAAHAAIDNLYTVAELLTALQRVGAQEQTAVLAARAAAHAAIDNPFAVEELLTAFRKAGAEAHARTLVSRLPAEGGFYLYLEQPGHYTQYRFGRQLDGSPADSWGWDDLDCSCRRCSPGPR